jgi:hypothetical protein
MHTKFVRKLEEKRPFERSGISGKKILKLILKE